LTVYLAPPILARPDPVTGVSRKREFGPWIFTAFSLLARFKGLRGTTFDIFGRSADRKLERQLIRDYELLCDRALKELSADTLDMFVALLNLPEQIRGFGPVKERHVTEVEARKATLLAELAGKISGPGRASDMSATRAAEVAQ
jgi:indolepyruvate ferredoxin oxidoreductase